MSKHQPVRTTLSECINRIGDYAPWFEVMGIELPGHAAKMAEVTAAEDAEEFDLARSLLIEAEEIEAQYIRQHGDDEIVVVWPDHVVTPRYNGDASYQ